MKNSSFIVSNFPKNYQKMTYVELSFGKGSMLFIKEPSKEEVINDVDNETTMNFRTIRDQPGYCIRSLKKSKGKSRAKTDIQAVVANLMAEKKNIIQATGQIKKLAKRLEDVYILNKTPITIIKAFNNPETLLFINSLQKKTGEKIQPSLEQVNLAEQIKDFKGKTILISLPSSFYNRFFKGWKCTKKSDVCVWMNWKN